MHNLWYHFNVGMTKKIFLKLRDKKDNLDPLWVIHLFLFYFQIQLLKHV